jgi:hypothetical protein
MVVVSSLSLVAFWVIIIGYIIQSSILQYIFYYLKSNKSVEWKIRKDSIENLGDFSW